MSNSRIKNPRKIYSQYSDYSSLAAAISVLNNNVYKVTYYEIISGASGTITLPSGATINANEFAGADCVLSEVDGNNKPTFITPLDGSNNPVTATLNTSTGAWVKSGTTVSVNVALIYSLNITALNYSNLNNFYIIESALLSTGVAGSGLTLSLTGNVFSLGGALTGNTNLDGAYDFLIGDNIPVNKFFVGSTAWSGFSVNDGTDNTRVDVFPTFARIRSTDGVVTNDFTVTKSNATLLSNLDLSTNKFIGSALQANSSAGGALKANGGSDCMTFGAGSGQNVTFLDGVKLDGGTASRILGTDANKNITYLNTTGTGSVVLATSPTIQTSLSVNGNANISSVVKINTTSQTSSFDRDLIIATTAEAGLSLYGGTGNSQTFIFGESNTNFAMAQRNGSTVSGNWGGSSVPFSNSAAFYNGSTLNQSTIIGGTPIINIIGNNAANIGTRLDANGLRIAPLSTLHTSNGTNSRLVVNGSTGDNYLQTSADGGTILSSGSGIPLTAVIRASSANPVGVFSKADNSSQTPVLRVNRGYGVPANAGWNSSIAFGLPNSTSVFSSVNDQVFLDAFWEQATTPTPTSGHFSAFRIRTSSAGTLNTQIDVRSNGVAIGQALTGASAATAVLDVAASTTALASLRIRSGVAPTTPNDGDIWFDGTDLKLRAGGVTYTIDKT